MSSAFGCAPYSYQIPERMWSHQTKSKWTMELSNIDLFLFRHVPGQRPTAPAYYGQTAPQQQARTPHPNYSNVQAGSDMYQQQKPYRQMTPSRMPMPGAPHQMSGPGAQQRMHPPSGSGYRHPSMSGPPEQYPGYYPPGGQSQTPSYQSTLGGYSQQHQPQEPATKKVFFIFKRGELLARVMCVIQ